ncbi:hypothetical protein [Nocardia lijiangensis]|uniref:hypothetical protein n=1 Tax=Nocardia lijiangensis TaxID=299618 RepID=UPI003D70F05D
MLLARRPHGNNSRLFRTAALALAASEALMALPARPPRRVGRHECFVDTPLLPVMGDARRITASNGAVIAAVLGPAVAAVVARERTRATAAGITSSGTAC